MAKQKFSVTGPFTVYDTPPGGAVELDADDPLVQANVTAGVIGPYEEPSAPQKTPCPACVEQDMSRPTRVSSQEELAAHYGEKHPALVVPSITEGR